MGLRIEISDGCGGWRPVAGMRPGDREGSISDSKPGRRDVIMFRCEPGRSVIRRSRAGADWEQGAERAVVPLAGFEELAVLVPGESFEMAVTSDRGVSYVARWVQS
jgi:hypothetical protein